MLSALVLMVGSIIGSHMLAPATAYAGQNSAKRDEDAGYRPALDTRLWRGAVAAPKTRMAVLGSAHLSEIDGFDPAKLGPLLDKLADFKPMIITIEGVSGEQCNVLAENPAIYGDAAETYCSPMDDAQAATGLTFEQARAAAETMLQAWPASPLPAQRRRLAALFLASGDMPSAKVQWLQLDKTERRAADGIDGRLLAALNRTDLRPNERIEIAAVLAARLGLQRVHLVDDQTALAIWTRAGSKMDEAMQAHWAGAQANITPPIMAYDRARANLRTGGDVLAFFKLLNAEDTQLAFVELDFKRALGTDSPGYYGQQYYSFNDVRNWRMVANILDVSANQPGARVLNIVGASHKPYYEQYLNMVPYVDLVDVQAILN